MKRFLFLFLALSVCSLGLTYIAVAQTKGEICDNGTDDDGDKLVDCDDPDCKCEPPPPPKEGNCSPGYWKNHPTEFNQACQAAADLEAGDSFASCSDILTALTCRGSDSSCKRSEAAALMNRVTGCTE